MTDFFYADGCTRVIVTDGNFSMQSMYMKKPWEDVALTVNEGFNVEDIPYREHLAESVEYKQVLQFSINYIQMGRLMNNCPQKSTCRNHRAHNVGDSMSSNLRATGLELAPVADMAALCPLFGRLSKRGEVRCLLYVCLSLTDDKLIDK
jgi:hypothetical protein